MQDRRSEDRRYTLTLVAFLIGLVALGLLGVPALLVAAIGVAVAALAIGLFHRLLVPGKDQVGRAVVHKRVPDRYVPSVLESSSVRRRRLGPRRRHRDASLPLRFR